MNMIDTIDKPIRQTSVHRAYFFVTLFKFFQLGTWLLIGYAFYLIILELYGRAHGYAASHISTLEYVLFSSVALTLIKYYYGRFVLKHIYKFTHNCGEQLSRPGLHQLGAWLKEKHYESINWAITRSEMSQIYCIVGGLFALYCFAMFPHDVLAIDSMSFYVNLLVLGAFVFLIPLLDVLDPLLFLNLRQVSRLDDLQQQVFKDSPVALALNDAASELPQNVIWKNRDQVTAYWSLFVNTYWLRQIPVELKIVVIDDPRHSETIHLTYHILKGTFKRNYQQ